MPLPPPSRRVPSVSLSFPAFSPFSSEIPAVYQWHGRDAGGCPHHCNANVEEQSIRLVMSPRNARRTRKTFPFMGILHISSLFLPLPPPSLHSVSRKLEFSFRFTERERERELSWKNYESGGGEEDTYATYGRDCGGSVLNRERSTLSLSLRSDYRSNYLARHDRATPSSGDGIAAVPTGPSSHRVRPPSTTEVIVTSLLPFSTVFEPISARDDSYDFRYIPASPLLYYTLSLSLSLFFDRSHVYKLDLPPIILIFSRLSIIRG